MGFRGQYKNKRDRNEAEIVEQLRAHGLTVVHLDKPVDLLCGYGGRDYICEVKMPSATLTGPQEIFYESWRGSKTIHRTIEDADIFAQKVKGEK